MNRFRIYDDLVSSKGNCTWCAHPEEDHNSEGVNWNCGQCLQEEPVFALTEDAPCYNLGGRALVGDDHMYRGKYVIGSASLYRNTEGKT